MCLMASPVWYTNPCLLVPEVVRDVVFYAVQHFDIGNLFPVFYVVVDDNLIVEQIDGVYENVDDAAAEIHVEQVAFAEGFQPALHVLDGVADRVCHFQFCEVDLRVLFLRADLLHAVVQRLTGVFRHFEGCVDELV